MHWWNDGHMGIMHPCNAPNLRPFCRGVLPLFRHIALTVRRSLKIIEIQRVLLRFNKDAAASPPSSQTYPIETGSPRPSNIKLLSPGAVFSKWSPRFKGSKVSRNQRIKKEGQLRHHDLAAVQHVNTLGQRNAHVALHLFAVNGATLHIANRNERFLRSHYDDFAIAHVHVHVRICISSRPISVFTCPSFFGKHVPSRTPCGK